MAERLGLEPEAEMAEEYGESMRALWGRYMERAA
jgi:hypothetical protein